MFDSITSPDYQNIIGNNINNSDAIRELLNSGL